jgi:anti-sigma regulatory factor (Ser/Thr protein kinase)
MEKRFLIARWLGSSDAQPTPIYDEASVSAARQRVRETAQRFQLSKEISEKVALIASELTHNQLAHSKQGYFVVRPIERQHVKGLEVIAADIGPGIARPTHAIQDAIAPQSSLGTGLGAVCRLADEVEFDNRLLEGMCIVVRNFEKRPPSQSCEIAIMGKPFPGEMISGDDAVFFHSESGVLAGVADGLGHGPEAREASNVAVEALSKNRQMDLDRIVFTLNQELGSTRGCAMSIARFNDSDRTLECASVGDVHCHLYNSRDAHFFTSTPLVLGAAHSAKPRIRTEKATVEPGSILVIFTDGLKSRTTLKGQLDVLRQPPIAIAEHLLETYRRPDDDALVLVARFLR